VEQEEGKMIKRCDICGKKMVRWLHISVGIGAARNDVNIADLLDYRGECDVCKECMDQRNQTIGVDMREEEMEAQ
jgi:hypothetical protein